LLDDNQNDRLTLPQMREQMISLAASVVGVDKLLRKDGKEFPNL
jgi:hypothetical protein